MKYLKKEAFDKVNPFGTGVLNEQFAPYFVGNSYINPLTNPKECPVFMANISFEPSCRNNWHIHHAKTGGGQILICTAGEGWYQEEGKSPESLTEGSFVYIAPGVKHWHGAKKDSWFSHISVNVNGEETRNEWLEPVSDSDYKAIVDNSPLKKIDPLGQNLRYTSKKTFSSANVFGTGMYNFFLKKYFTGKSYLKMLTNPRKVPLFFSNVTFEPTCRNNWHIHHAQEGGGQILLCTAGLGWYQAEGEEARPLKPGDLVYIPANVKHWHGAQKETWFSHIALAVPGKEGKNEWCERVSDSVYNQL